MEISIIITLSMAVICFLIVPTIFAFLIGAPLLFSPKKALSQALQMICAKPDEKFYDLGAGNGRAMVIAANDFGLDVSGFELSPLIYYMAKLNLYFSNVKKAKLYLNNYYTQCLSNADIVYCFLTPHAMAKLKPKFENELKPGARIISYAFRIPGWEESNIIDCKKPGKIFIYLR